MYSNNLQIGDGVCTLSLLDVLDVDMWDYTTSIHNVLDDVLMCAEADGLNVYDPIVYDALLMYSRDRSKRLQGKW